MSSLEIRDLAATDNIDKTSGCGVVGTAAPALPDRSSPAHNTAHTARSGNRKKFISLVLRIAVSAVLLALLLSKANLHKITSELLALNPAWALAGLVVGIVTIWLSSWQWQILLRHERIAIGMPTLMGLYFVGLTFGQLLPSSVGGDVAKAAYVARLSGRGVGAASATLMARVIGLMALFLTTLPVALAASLLAPDFGWSLALILLASAAGYLFTLAVLLFSPSLLARLVGTWLARSRIGRTVLEVADAIAVYRRRPDVFLSATLASLVFYAFSNLNFYVYGLALHMHSPFWFYWIAIPLTSLATMLPISLNGYGVRGASFVAVFAVMGEISAKALSLSLAMEAQMLLFALLGGIFVLALNRRLAARAIPDNVPSRRNEIMIMPSEALAPQSAATSVVEAIQEEQIATEADAPIAEQTPSQEDILIVERIESEEESVAEETKQQEAPEEEESANDEEPEPPPVSPEKELVPALIDAIRVHRKTIAVAAAAVLLLVVATPLATSHLFKGTPHVKLYTVTMQSLTNAVGGGGLTYPAQEFNISYPVAAQVTKVDVQVGQPVQAGQPLITLDAAGLTAQLQVAYDQWQIATNYLNTLLSQGASSAQIAGAQQQVDVAKSRYDTLNQQINSSSFNNGNIDATAAGVVTAINVSAGSLFKSGDKLLTVQDTSSIIVRAQFPLEQYQAVKVGESAEVDSDAQAGQRFAGKVTSVVPALTSPGSSTFEVWITVPNPNGQLFTAESVYARINGQEVLPAVPEMAIVNADTDPSIFVYANGRAHIRHVAIGARDGDRFGITAGLNPGDQVILVGQYQLTDGERVVVSR